MLSSCRASPARIAIVEFQGETRRFHVALAVAVVLGVCAGLAAQAPSAGPYSVLKTAKVGGLGGFDYVFADVAY